MSIIDLADPFRKKEEAQRKADALAESIARMASESEVELVQLTEALWRLINKERLKRTEKEILGMRKDGVRR